MSAAIILVAVQGRTFAVRLSREGTMLTAAVDIQTSFGPIHVTASADEAVVRNVCRAIARSRLASWLSTIHMQGRWIEPAAVAGALDAQACAVAPRIAADQVLTELARGIAHASAPYPARVPVGAYENAFVRRQPLDMVSGRDGSFRIAPRYRYGLACP